MVEIIPAVMPRSLAHLREAVGEVKAEAETVQADIMDGIFVPEATWPYVSDEGGEFETLKEQKNGLPYWDEVNVETDLMVATPEEAAEEWLSAGVHRVIVHFESSEHIGDILQKLSPHRAANDELDVGVAEVGIAIGVETPVSHIASLIPHVDLVQCMGIAQIGFQGEPFDERALEQVRALRREYPDVTISVDGGVGFHNAHELVQAGANRLVAGSAIFGSEDPLEAIRELKKLVN